MKRVAQQKGSGCVSLTVWGYQPQRSGHCDDREVRKKVPPGIGEFGARTVQRRSSVRGGLSCEDKWRPPLRYGFKAPHDNCDCGLSRMWGKIKTGGGV